MVATEQMTSEQEKQKHEDHPLIKTSEEHLLSCGGGAAAEEEELGWGLGGREWPEERPTLGPPAGLQIKARWLRDCHCRVGSGPPALSIRAILRIDSGHSSGKLVRGIRHQYQSLPKNTSAV